jgi:hypothetical protein
MQLLTPKLFDELLTQASQREIAATQQAKPYAAAAGSRSRQAGVGGKAGSTRVVWQLVGTQSIDLVDGAVAQ